MNEKAIKALKSSIATWDILANNTMKTPDTIFSTVKQAEVIVKAQEDDWHYVVEPLFNGKAKIKVHDENNSYLGYL